MPPIHHFAIYLQRAHYRNPPVKSSITSSVIAQHFTFLGISFALGTFLLEEYNLLRHTSASHSSPLTISLQYSRSFFHRVSEECGDLPFRARFHLYSRDIYSVVCRRP